MRLSTPALIPTIRRHHLGGALLRDGTFDYVVFVNPVRMRPIIRKSEEFFTQTIARVAGTFDVVVNGNLYGLDYLGYLDTLLSNDPIAASHTSSEGRVIENGQVLTGRSSPLTFWFAEILDAGKRARKAPRWHYESGQGDPPQGANVVAGIGGLGPIISRNLPYGVGNEYRPPKNGPRSGDPGRALSSYLTSRNNATFASAENRDIRTGKTIIAYHAKEQALLVGVQPNGSNPGHRYGGLRRDLVGAGFSDAVFGDGSDSSLLWYKARQVVAPGQRKDETITVGLGFIQTHSLASKRVK